MVDDAPEPIPGHSGMINCIAFSPSGLLLATASYDKSIRLWDSASGRVVSVLKGHSGVVNTVVWAPNGSTLASGGADETVRVWDARSGMEVRGRGGRRAGVQQGRCGMGGARGIWHGEGDLGGEGDGGWEGGVRWEWYVGWEGEMWDGRGVVGWEGGGGCGMGGGLGMGGGCGIERWVCCCWGTLRVGAWLVVQGPGAVHARGLVCEGMRVVQGGCGMEGAERGVLGMAWGAGKTWAGSWGRLGRGIGEWTPGWWSRGTWEVDNARVHRGKGD